MSAGVVVIGSLTIDLTSRSTLLPSPGETVLGTEFTMVPGGKGANQALAAAQMGVPTWMVGCVGDDMFRSVVVSRMEAAGVRLDHLRVVPGMATGVAHIRVDGAGENNIVMVPLANGALRGDDIDAALDALAGQVSVALIQLEIPFDVATHAVRVAHAAGLIVVLDPAPAPPTPLPVELYGTIDLVTPNESEASVLSGIDVVDRASAGRAGAWFVERGCASAAITLGAKGAIVVSRDGGERFVPPLTVTTVDTTAAGDAFAGTIGSRLAAGDDLDAAVRWASAAGALTVTRMGASSALPSLAAVQDLLERSGSRSSKEEQQP